MTENGVDNHRGNLARLTGSTEQGAPPPRPHRRAVAGFAWSLGAAALATGAALAGAGEPLPAPGPVLLLALAVALCINRFAFFSSEIAATAEVAVLLAAVVGFRDDAWLLGPLAVGLLVGPLDAMHWERRSFLRMAYNAGNRSLATLAAALAFALVYEHRGSTTALLLAMVAAAIAFALVDSGITVTLLVIQGEPSPRAATAHVLELDALTVPLALAGAAAGILATEIGWWAAAPVFVPLAFVPELALGRTGWRGVAVRNAVMSAVLLTMALVVVAQLPVSDAAIALLVVLAAMLGTELVVDARAPVPPLLALVVIAAVVLLQGRVELVAAMSVAVVGTLTAWITSARRARRPLAAPTYVTVMSAAVVAAGAGALGTLVGDVVRPGSGAELAFRSSTELAAACAAGTVFALGVSLFGRGHGRGRAARDLVWLAPVFGVAGALALVWHVLGRGSGAGSTVFGAGVAVALAALAWWGAPPWRSRMIGRVIAARAGRGHLPVMFAVASVALIAAAAARFEHGDARTLLVLGAIATGESVVGMALIGVRQWRFAPRRRLREAAVLLAAASALTFVYPGPALRGEWWALGLLVAGMSVAIACAAPLAGHVDGGEPLIVSRTRSRTDR